jgi:3-oxoacyl-[acyl-carrier protein] reductase
MNLINLGKSSHLSHGYPQAIRSLLNRLKLPRIIRSRNYHGSSPQNLQSGVFHLHNGLMNQAVITGGNGTLGRAIVAALQAPQWEVHSPAKSELDVTIAAETCGYFRQLSTDLLVCAAGIIRDAPILKTSEIAWDDVFAVNFKGAYNCAKAVLPSMEARRSGHIIFISSFSAIRPPQGQSAYAAAKAALIGLTKQLANDHGHQGIRVNTILPGLIPSRMTANLTPTQMERFRNDHALKRFNGVVEVAKFIRFLHHELPHTSGQIFQLDSRIA